MNGIKELKIKGQELSTMNSKLLTNAANSRSKVEAAYREWVALDAAVKERRRELRS
jgi:hypothetical protein